MKQVPGIRAKRRLQQSLAQTARQHRRAGESSVSRHGCWAPRNGLLGQLGKSELAGSSNGTTWRKAFN